MKVRKGIPILNVLKDDISKKEYKNKFLELGLDKNRITSFLEDFQNMEY